MRKHIIVGLAVAALLALALPSMAAPKAPADELVAPPAGATLTQGQVMFSHKTGHASYDCKTCHHTWDGKGEPTKCSSAGCHTDMKSKKGGGSFYAAFHAPQSKNSCLGCHREAKKAGKAKAPTSCTQCHPKKS
ncbi:Cytochrome c, class III, conserved region [Desulfovibrio sp. X2]|uniref:cytochrome c3 family protein n=1 Tax=Desulfovibrio sp. X2 TaxID=941449 RepID=UPI000358AE41|nr:cytochrome c3 family protein [Desulfovibrio sp. X2]EPR44737.1 Cytochrome c, class III, conserved region [Desulfovibrio sp. X2]